MSENRLVRQAELTTFAHATEDLTKVKKAAFNLIKDSDLPFIETKLTGHYDDPIILLLMKINQKKQATELLDSLYKRLNLLDKKQILDTLSNRIDESGNLYIRFDKQRAYRDVVAIQENDPIRIKFKLQVPHKTDPAIMLHTHLEQIEAFE